MIRMLCLVFCVLPWMAQADALKMAVTTSFHNSGLSDILLPALKDDTGLDVQLLIVGTGQALRLGEAGDVDAILVHSKAAEEAFVAAGFGTHRREIMYNDFVFVGPSDDPAQISQSRSAVDAMQRVRAAKHPFVSRGDDSGTHKAELSLWAAAELDPDLFDSWYSAVGSGMGAALNTAVALEAYVISDRASWLNFGNKSGFDILFAGDEALFNQYAFIPVNPARHPHINHGAAQVLENWLTGDRAKDIINRYRVDEEAVFFFNASPR